MMDDLFVPPPVPHPHAAGSDCSHVSAAFCTCIPQKIQTLASAGVDDTYVQEMPIFHGN